MVKARFQESRPVIHGIKGDKKIINYLIINILNKN